MARENALRVGVDFAKGDRLHPGPLKAKGEAADATEQVQHFEPLTRTVSGRANGYGGACAGMR
jgi:hypothetical protein